jgi:hypothetical protein
LLQRLLTRRVDCSKDVTTMRVVFRASTPKRPPGHHPEAPAKRIVLTSSLNVNINENDSHYNYRQIKQALQNQFLTAFNLFGMKLFSNVLDSLGLQRNGL